MVKNFRSVMTGVALGACLVAGVSGQALAADTGTDAATRLAEARAAYEAALAELKAAEAEVAAETRATAQTETASSDTTDTGAAATIASQPEEQPGFFDWDAWEKSIDLGLNGSSGNSENLNFRVQLGAERKTDKLDTSMSLLYRLASSDGDKTENRLRYDIRNDWLPPEGSKIRWWAKGSYEYDEFQDWDSRIAASAGIGYDFIKNDKHTLIGRLGFGGSQTYGGMEDDFRPEAVAGLDYVYNIKDGQVFKAGTELLLDVSDVDLYRLNSYANYEVLVDAESNMVFKTGVAHRYDSEPGGGNDKSDVDYYATLGWKF